MTELCAQPALERRLVAIMAQWQTRARLDLGRELTPEQLARARERVREELHSHERHFAVFRNEYFWIDRFPENDARFPVTLSDCLADVD